MEPICIYITSVVCVGADSLVIVTLSQEGWEGEFARDEILPSLRPQFAGSLVRPNLPSTCGICNLTAEHVRGGVVCLGVSLQTHKNSFKTNSNRFPLPARFCAH